MRYRLLLYSLLSSSFIVHGAYAATKSVKVGYGESIGTIASKYKLSPKEIVRLNRIKPPFQVYVGQTLLIPMPASKPIAAKPIKKSIASSPPKKSIPVVAVKRTKPAPVPVKVAPKAPEPVEEAMPALKSQEPIIHPAAKPTVVGGEPLEQMQPPSQDEAKFIWPVHGHIVSNFGKKENGLRNDGINIQADKGSPVVAVAAGTVVHSSNEIRGFGNLILLKHEDGWMTAYAHTDEVRVHKGQRVNKGDVLAVVGETGHVSAPQLHFELRHRGKTVDPTQYLPAVE